MQRCAKIVATIGPASQDESMLRRLILAGMDVARINFSHGSREEHAAVIALLRGIAGEMGKAICVLQDLRGPKIRVGEIPGGMLELRAGEKITLCEAEMGEIRAIPIDFPGLARAVQPEGRILLDDGNIELVVLQVKGTLIETQVVVGGVLKSRKGVNLPFASLNIPAMTHKDYEDLKFGLDLGVDAIALSFVRSSADVIHLREMIKGVAPQRAQTPIIAKLERPEALDNLEEIMADSDGVMVARGDLGVEMSPESVPVAQKRIIDCANRQGKMVITATQMLDSMIHNPRPTRAEASDVANAILDGSDAVMLSGETAVGAYPVESVTMMDAIVCQAETGLSHWSHWHGPEYPVDVQDDAYYVTLAARELAHDRNVAGIAAFTKTGRTALALSKTRPGVPILAFTPDSMTYPRLGMYWGVTPYLVPEVNSVEEIIIEVENAFQARGEIQAGQQVVIICGFPVHEIRPTNLALLYTIGSFAR